MYRCICIDVDMCVFVNGDPQSFVLFLYASKNSKASLAQIPGAGEDDEAAPSGVKDFLQRTAAWVPWCLKGTSVTTCG